MIVVRLPVRGALIGQWYCPARVHFAPCFAFHQHGKSPLCHGQFGFLAGDDIRQFLNRAGEVGDLFFEVCQVSHAPALTQLHAR